MRLKAGTYAIEMVTIENGWRQAHIFCGVNNNRPDGQAQLGDWPDSVVVTSHGPWGASTYSIETPAGYLYQDQLLALQWFLSWIRNVVDKNARAWRAEEKKGFKSTKRYPDWRLRQIVDGKPMDWDDNASPIGAARELKRRQSQKAG